MFGLFQANLCMRVCIAGFNVWLIGTRQLSCISIFYFYLGRILDLLDNFRPSTFFVNFQFELCRGYGNCCWELYCVPSWTWREFRWSCSGGYWKVTYITPWSTPVLDMLVFTSELDKTTANCLAYICRRMFVGRRKVLSCYFWLRFGSLTCAFYRIAGIKRLQQVGRLVGGIRWQLRHWAQMWLGQRQR